MATPQQVEQDRAIERAWLLRVVKTLRRANARLAELEDELEEERRTLVKAADDA